jgi:hypothetical protein
LEVRLHHYDGRLRASLSVGLTIFGIPAPMFTGLGTLGLTVAFFNLIRMGRRPCWFQHRLRALLSNHHHRSALPQDDLNESWLLK